MSLHVESTRPFRAVRFDDLYRLETRGTGANKPVCRLTRSNASRFRRQCYVCDPSFRNTQKPRACCPGLSLMLAQPNQNIGNA